MIWRLRFVHRVPVRTSPVAVRVAVHSWASIRARDDVSGAGKGMTEVGVGRVPSAPKEPIVGRHNDRADLLGEG